MWLGKVLEGSGIKVYNFLLRGDVKPPADGADKKYKRVTSTLKFSKKTAYNELIDMVCFQIVEEGEKKVINTLARQLIIFDPATGDSMTIIQKKP